VHLAEAIESKHRVRERLVRALARVPESGGVGRPFDPAGEELAVSEADLGLNPLGEYLLNCELANRAFNI
jgi:hypothetical protein